MKRYAVELPHSGTAARSNELRSTAQSELVTTLRATAADLAPQLRRLLPGTATRDGTQVSSLLRRQPHIAPEEKDRYESESLTISNVGARSRST
jgi:hypothetical protein